MKRIKQRETSDCHLKFFNFPASIRTRYWGYSGKSGKRPAWKVLQ